MITNSATWERSAQVSRPRRDATVRFNTAGDASAVRVRGQETRAQRGRIRDQGPGAAPRGARSPTSRSFGFPPGEPEAQSLRSRRFPEELGVEGKARTSSSLRRRFTLGAAPSASPVGRWHERPAASDTLGFCRPSCYACGDWDSGLRGKLLAGSITDGPHGGESARRRELAYGARAETFSSADPSAGRLEILFRELGPCRVATTFKRF